LKLMPEVNQLIYSTVAFFVLLFVLAKYAFPPIVGMMEKRENTIRESLEKADETRREAEKLLEDYKKQLAEARNEAQQIIERAKKQTAETRKEIVSKAEQEAKRIIAQAEEEIESNKQKSFVELHDAVADLAIMAASKVISKSLNKEDHLRLVEECIAEVKHIQ
jgi:F-type H+-transporting ATPase subunit b